jgi:hypothetical protein
VFARGALESRLCYGHRNNCRRCFTAHDGIFFTLIGKAACESVYINNIYESSPYLTGNITSPLQSPTGYCCLGKQSLFTVGTVRSTQIHSVGRINFDQDTAYLTYKFLDFPQSLQTDSRIRQIRD